MNQTGGETMKKGATQQPGGNQPLATGMPDPTAYIEEPRPNLFNIVKNMRENKVKLNMYYF